MERVIRTRRGGVIRSRRGVFIFHFDFARFGNFEDVFCSLVIYKKSKVLLALFLASSCLLFTAEGVFLRCFIGLMIAT